MKPSGSHWLAISALLLTTFAANAGSRPHYGGTLHITTRTSPRSLDPAEIADSLAGRNLIALIFDTLVSVDSSGHPQGALATSWESAGDRRLELHLRRNLKFHDGSPLTAEIAAASLRKINPAWNVTAAGDLVAIDSSNSASELLQELALPRNAIAKRDSSAKIIGTGPFQIVDWQPLKRLTLTANEDYWAGRPFLDQIEITLGISFRDQMNALQSGRADLVEVAADQIRMVSQRYHFLRSSPVELIALQFARDATSTQEKSARDALRFSIERRSMHDVLLQGAGQPTASLLPGWMNGYAFVFSTQADLARAQQLRDQIPGVPSFTLGFDSNDPLARLLAERLALNAKDAGLWVQLNPVAADFRLIRMPLESPDPWVSLEELGRELALTPMAVRSGTIDQLFASEQAMLANGRVIPLFHLPVSYASVTNLLGWRIRDDGTLDLASSWFKGSAQ